MKKAVSVILSAVTALSSSIAITANAEKYGENGQNLIVLGDSIAAGYGLEDNEYNYGQICADYIDGNVENYAHSGDTTQDMLSILENLSEEQQNAIKEADTVIISIGGNDIIHYASKAILDFCARNNLLKEGYTSADVPEEPTFVHLKNMVDIDAVGTYMNGSLSNIRSFNLALNNLRNNLARTSADAGNGSYENYIENNVIPNIKTAVSKISAINPNAEIVVQTIYDPLQFEEEYFKSLVANKQSIIRQLQDVFKDVLTSFSTQVKAIEGVKIADIYDEFTGDNNNAWYFTDMQEDSANMDFHPNKKGHLAIAGVILDTIGATPSENGSILRQTFINLDDNDLYPENALERYNKYKGSYILGDNDGDNIIDSTDASVILAEYALLSTGSSPSFDDLKKGASDIDKDGQIDASDASSVLAYYSYVSTGGTVSFKNFLNEKIKNN